MREWRVFSSADMVNWTDHGSPMILATFTWADAERVGRAGRRHATGSSTGTSRCGSGRPAQMAIGVGVSDSPTGPFRDAIGRPLVDNGEIDPTVFIDDDGQAYLYWGNPHLWYVRLNADMISYSGSPTQIPLTTAGFGTRTGNAEPPDALRGRAVGLQAQRALLQRVRGQVLLRVHRLLHGARPDRAVDVPRHGHAHAGQQLHQPPRRHRLQRRVVLLLPQRRAAGRWRLHPLGGGGEVQLQRRRHHPDDQHDHGRARRRSARSTRTSGRRPRRSPGAPASRRSRPARAG